MDQTQSLGEQLAQLQRVKDEVIPERANQGPIFSVGEVVHVKGGQFQITRIEPGHMRLKSLPRDEKISMPASNNPFLKLPIIEREFLQKLYCSAHGMSVANLNPDWKRAYEALAAAADWLDAMQARSEASSRPRMPEDYETKEPTPK